jgi:hypothetical protein
MHRATMPETSVNKHCNLLLGKNKIRLSKKQADFIATLLYDIP